MKATFAKTMNPKKSCREFEFQSPFPFSQFPDQISIIFARQLMVRVPRSYSFLFCFMFLTFFVYIRLWLTLCGELLFTSQLSSKTRIFWPTGPPSPYQRLNWNHNKNMCIFKWSFVKEIFLNPRRYLIFYLWKDKTQVRIEKNLI